MKRLCFGLISIVLTCTAPAADMKTLYCVPTSTAAWIGSIRIDTSAKKAWITTKEPTAEHEVPLLHVGPEQFGAPIFQFNWRVEGSEDHVVNAFKLFRALDEWRLIEVGMQETNGLLLLKALGDSWAMKCVNSQLGQKPLG